jgi:hypothetical protein
MEYLSFIAPKNIQGRNILFTILFSIESVGFELYVGMPFSVIALKFGCSE